MHEITYDIESIYSVFTNTFIDNDSITLMFFGDNYYDRLSDEDLLKPIYDYVDKNHLMFEKAGISTTPEIKLLRYYSNSYEDAEKLGRELNKILYCQPLSTMNVDKAPVSYCGWNSYRYDLSLMAMTATMVLATGSLNNFHPSLIKALSDCIIHYTGPEWAFARNVQEMLDESQFMKYNWKKRWDMTTYKKNFNIAMWSERHIDWARLGRVTEEGQGNAYPPSLKKEMARYGFNIVMDDQVSMGGTDFLSDDLIYDLIYYNVNDVVGTRLIGQNQVIQSGLSTRDTIRRLYPYTSPKNTPFNKLNKWSPSERDCTAATLAGEVLIGPNRKKPIDYPNISYYFPLADGRYVDLLEFMKENEPFMHPYMYEFFAYFRGKDTTTNFQDFNVKRKQPITHGATINIPYYKDGKPLNVYIRASTGGAHGSVMAGLADKTEEEINEWIKTDTGAVGKQKVTLDLKNVVHVDWSSFYPTLASKMKLYIGSDGEDRYTGIITTRLDLKKIIPHDKSTWTHQDFVNNEDQDGLKFILNNATGAGNMHKKYALLPVDNKTISMRLIGNMHIWCLAQRMSQAGGYVFSTNTDGIYIAGLDLEIAQKVVDDYIEIYGLGVDPEFMPRMINRDTSNRIEFVDDKTINTIGGRLRHGRSLQYLDESLGRNIPYPLAVGNAVLSYMADDDKWLEKPFDRDKLRNYLLKIIEEDDSITPWYHIYVATSARNLLVGGEKQQRINRIILTNSGKKLQISQLRKAPKSHIMEIFNWYINRDCSLKELEEKLDVEFTFNENDKLSLARTIPINDGKDNKLIKINRSIPFKDKEEFDKLWDSIAKAKGSNLFLVNLSEELAEGEEREELKNWYYSYPTGYPQSEGIIINTAEEVKNVKAIDADLNIEAYTDWAESLLQTWKITGEIPELNLKSYDDNLGFKVAIKEKANRASIMEEEIKDLYKNIARLMDKYNK